MSSEIESKTTSTVQILRCPVPSCSFLTMLLNKLINHAKSSHEELKGINVLTCHLCKTISTDQSIILEHYKMFHDLDDDVSISEKFYSFSENNDPSSSPQNQDQSEEKLSENLSTNNGNNGGGGSRRRKAAHPGRFRSPQEEDATTAVASTVAAATATTTTTTTTTTGLESVDAASTLLATQLLLRNQQEQITKTLLALQQTQQSLLSTTNTTTTNNNGTKNAAALNLTSLINSLTGGNATGLLSQQNQQQQHQQKAEEIDFGMVNGGEKALDMSLRSSSISPEMTTSISLNHPQHHNQQQHQQTIIVSQQHQQQQQSIGNSLGAISNSQVLSLQQLQQLLQLHQVKKTSDAACPQLTTPILTTSPVTSTTTSSSVNNNNSPASILQSFIQGQNGFKAATLSSLPSGEVISLAPFWTNPTANLSSVIANGGLGSANLIPFVNGTQQGTTGASQFNLLSSADLTPEIKKELQSRLALQANKLSNGHHNGGGNIINLLDPRSAIQLQMNNTCNQQQAGICLQPQQTTNGLLTTTTAASTNSKTNGSSSTQSASPSVTTINNIIKTITASSNNTNNNGHKSLGTTTTPTIKTSINGGGGGKRSTNSNMTKLMMNETTMGSDSPESDSPPPPQTPSSSSSGHQHHHVNHGGGSKPHRQNFTPAQNRILANWYSLHQTKPYPSTDDTKMLATKTGLNYSQVKKWFANKRARTTNPSQLTKSPSGASMDGIFGKDSSQINQVMDEDQQMMVDDEVVLPTGLRFDLMSSNETTPTMVKKTLTVIAPKPVLHQTSPTANGGKPWQNNTNNKIHAQSNGNNNNNNGQESPADRAARIKQENECVIAIINEAKRESEEITGKKINSTPTKRSTTVMCEDNLSKEEEETSDTDEGSSSAKIRKLDNTCNGVGDLCQSPPSLQVEIAPTSNAEEGDDLAAPAPEAQT